MKKGIIWNAVFLLILLVRSVDATAALAIEGVHSFVDVDDVPGSNMVGVGPVKDDALFADKEARHKSLNLYLL